MYKAAALCLLAFATPAFADSSDITSVSVSGGNGTYRFDVTLRHPDTGWDHYADGWRVLDMNGNELGMRELVHPHVDEQPFTRSLSGVVIPAGVTQVRIQSRCNVDGWSNDMKTVTLP